MPTPEPDQTNEFEGNPRRTDAAMPRLLGAEAEGVIRRTERASDRAELALHELANLVEGSLRQLDLAARALRSRGAGTGGDDDTSGAGAMLDVQKHVETARLAMLHLAGCVRPRFGSAGAWAPAGEGLNALAALDFAVEALRPSAEGAGVALVVALSERLRGAPAMCLYAVAINALRNALQASLAAGGGAGRTIEVRAWAEDSSVVLEVLDDGPGPVPGTEARAFEHGFTTRAGSSGIGLAFVRSLVSEAGGGAELRARWPERTVWRGACFRAWLPVGCWDDAEIGTEMTGDGGGAGGGTPRDASGRSGAC